MTTETPTVTPTGILPDIEIPGAEPLTRILNVLSSPGLWARVGIGVAGSFLVIVGLVLMIAGTRAVKDVAKLATGVVTKGVVK